ncbi:MAG: hypothetical protein KGP29_00215 [Proteobacteria bacterium]|nr:hypothetical protein [Pseudomonadota bacterium]
MKTKKFLLTLLLVTISSCALTSAMWNKKYNDTIRNFFVSADGKYIAFLGQNFHYVLSDDSNILKLILSWNGRSAIFINTEKTELRLDRNNNISGDVVIECFESKTLLKEDRVLLTSLGFRRNNYNGELTLRLKISGKRYLPRSDVVYGVSSLRRFYVISIKQGRGVGASIAMTALTPITVTVDGVILLGKIILMPFGD